MNSYEYELRYKWDKISYHQGGTLQLDIEHPLEWHVGYFSPEEKSIVIVSDYPADKIDSSKSIHASCNVRKDGRYAISFTLTSREQEDVFVTMCGDMISYSCAEPEEKLSLNLVLRRYKAWLKLLRNTNSALLSSNEQKGLIGELLYLKERIENGLASDDAIAGWVGPEGADQDFVYDDGWHEIKTIGVSSSEITISSIEQLDCKQGGELIVLRVDKCAPAYSGAFTIYGLVHQIMNMIKNDDGTVEAFLLKLGSAGYIDMLEYNQQNFFFSSKQTYNVDATFPYMKRKELPTEIVNTSYILSIPGLAPWLQ